MNGWYITLIVLASIAIWIWGILYTLRVADKGSSRTHGLCSDDRLGIGVLAAIFLPLIFPIVWMQTKSKSDKHGIIWRYTHPKRVDIERRRSASEEMFKQAEEYRKLAAVEGIDQASYDILTKVARDYTKQAKELRP